MKAMDVIEYLLLDYGLSEKQINTLIARFLQEEAVEYIEYMEMCGINREDLKQINNDEIVH